MRRRVTFILTALAALLPTTRAWAYRPFDGTDADVASLGEQELEIGPVGYLHEPGHGFLVAPAFVGNWGLLPRTELVLQGNNVVLLNDVVDEPRWRLVDTALLVKNVLREGGLQEKSGPSIASEVGVLLPTVNDEEWVGASASVIFSQRWDDLTAHLNLQLALTRTTKLESFASVILEGPFRWRVRPVSEVFVEKEPARDPEVSGLVGAIWRSSESVALDLGLRGALVEGGTAYEVRAGFSWGMWIF